MIKRLLIANRGEIACRIMRSCRAMGIETVAVYSSADRFAKHVRQADQAYYIGEAPSTDSYLCIDKIIDVAKQSQADAIHPGYGFLSENTQFAVACADAGIVFVGPSASAMGSMASKSDAKTLMAKADVPLIPGYYGDNQDPAFLKQQAAQMGCPLLIKAAAGGGGKGMRVVDSIDQFDAALASTITEAKNSFGDTKMLLEKLIVNARHVEVQIITDSQGNGLYIGDRDCSVQRRHQKVIEECPAPGLSDALRQSMGETSVKAALSIGYQNAGTFEYLVTDDQFYFMEMNTRLQVEHPVTEAVYGVDLVKMQLMVAAGQALPLTQQDLVAKGHAVEARIYAESPADNFMPSAGHISQWAWPTSTGLRLESAVDAGDWVTPYYDPMVAKVITHAHSRQQSLQELCDVLDQSTVVGITTNRGFVKQIVTQPTFIGAEMTTEWLQHWLEQDDCLVSADLGIPHTNSPSVKGPFGNDCFKLNLPSTQQRASASQFAAEDSVSATGDYRAPMNGRVLEIAVATDQAVTSGDLLAVVEAMKMEHRITAAANGVVTQVLANADQMVTGGELIIEVNHD